MQQRDNIVDDRDLSSFQPRESPRHGFRGEQGLTRTRPAIPVGLSIAISREAGARGGTIGRRVGRKLAWEVYDQELLEYVVQDGTVQRGLVDNLSEPAAAWVEERLRDLTREYDGGLPPAVLDMARLSLALGSQGHVVLIGRGAGFLLPRPTTLHVRLVAPLEDRIAYMAQWLRLTQEEARQRVRVRDARRNEFLTTFLHRQPGEIYGYDLILNTSSFGEEHCTELIVQAARLKEAHWQESPENNTPEAVGQ
jgi:Cytidylate kinase-like family